MKTTPTIGILLLRRSLVWILFQLYNRTGPNACILRWVSSISPSPSAGSLIILYVSSEQTGMYRLHLNVKIKRSLCTVSSKVQYQYITTGTMKYASYTCLVYNTHRTQTTSKLRTAAVLVPLFHPLPMVAARPQTAARVKSRSVWNIGGAA